MVPNTIAGMDTPWHIGYAKKAEDDPCRDKRCCIFLKHGKCTNGVSGAFALRCPGSSHCERYTEEYKEDEYIKAERLDFETVLFRTSSREEIWKTYGNNDRCPFGDYNEITKTEDRLTCPRCELILRKPEEIPNRTETKSGIIIHDPNDLYAKPKWIQRETAVGLVVVPMNKGQKVGLKKRPLIALPGDSSCRCMLEDGSCNVSGLMCHCKRKEECMFYGMGKG